LELKSTREWLRTTVQACKKKSSLRSKFTLKIGEGKAIADNLYQGLGHYMFNTTRLVIALCTLLSGSYITVQSQNLPIISPVNPKLIRCTPATVTPGVSIKLQGSHFGSMGSEQVKVLFIQDGSVYSKEPSGAGRTQLKDSESISEHVSLEVPEGLKPGKCQIFIEVNGLASAPLMIEIATAVLPAEIHNPKPLVAQPGETVWIEVLGISQSDEVELIDAMGQIRNLDVRTNSEGIEAGFTLPDDLPGGEIRFCVVEKRSGLNQRSNILSLQIEAGPAPLILYLPGHNVKPLAPGQWLDAAVENNRAAERAERIEVAFIQNEQVIVAASPFKRSENSRLHVRVPNSLFPGRIKMMTRTWLKRRVSPWSEAFELELLDHAAAPYLWSICLAKPKGTEQLIQFDSSLTKVITAQAGDTLMVSGLFLVESVRQLQITLEGEEEKFKLKPSEAGDPASLSFTLPRKLKSGEWRIIINNLEQSVSVNVPVILRVE
jgi:hypothetical protein